MAMSADVLIVRADSAGCVHDWPRRRVIGVEAEVEGAATTLSAGMIVLCAGAIASPLLLMRSGIGPAAGLAAAGVACLADRAGIGDNLHDHLLTAGNFYRAKREVPMSRLGKRSRPRWPHRCWRSGGRGRPGWRQACNGSTMLRERPSARCS